MLLETRRHGGTQPPEWSRCDRHPVPPTLAANNADEGASSGSATLTATSGSGSGGSGGGRVGGNHGHRRAGGGGASSSRKYTACCEIVVLVEGLTPRTYYSFRASAVNARGAGEPGLPCRRVRTAAARSPSWGLGHNVVNPTLAAPSLGGEKGGGDGVGGGGVAVASTHFACAPPQAVCSGLGACTVRWEEPYSNGSVIEMYEVEVVRIGPEVIGKGGGATAEVKEGQDVHDDDTNANSGHDSHPTDAATVTAPDEEKAELNEDTQGRVVDRGVGEKRPEEGSLPPSMSEKKQKEEATGEATAAETPPPPPEVISVPLPEPSGRSGGGDGRREEVVREVKQRFTRSVQSHMRHLVVRGLTTGDDYVFRVRASNAAGMGEAGLWTQVVRVIDPADEDSL